MDGGESLEIHPNPRDPGEIIAGHCVPSDHFFLIFLSGPVSLLQLDSANLEGWEK